MESFAQIIDCTRSESSQGDTIIRGNFHDNKLYVFQGAGWECVAGATSQAQGSVPLGRILDIHVVEGGFKVDDVPRVCGTLEEVQEALQSKKRPANASTRQHPRKKPKLNAAQMDDMKEEAMQVLASERQQLYLDQLYAAKEIAFPDMEAMGLLEIASQLYMGGGRPSPLTP